MKKQLFDKIVFAILFLIPVTVFSQSTWTVTGFVKEDKEARAMVGVTISVQDRSTGTITDQRGFFQLSVPGVRNNFILNISHVGFETQQIKVTAPSSHLDIIMIENHLEAKEVVVTASRVSETILEAPVSILKMDANAVKETPAENFYAALPDYKGVDVLTNSILYKTINTRGFNNNANFRLVQLIDGIDNSLVGLGWPLGNVLGATDLDIEKVELIPGPASALYGANAFNGLVYITTKDPFRYQGFSAQVKNGFNQPDPVSNDPALYTDLQLRYAKAFNGRFAFKVNAGYLRGSDWLLTDSSDIYLYVDDDLRGPDNPARNAVNIYGDEVVKRALVTDAQVHKIDVSRTGYYVHDLIDNASYSFKANAAANYRLNNHLELSYAFNFSQATTSYSNLFNLKNILMYTNKLELKGAHFFIRAASLANDLGDSYNANSLAVNINKKWKTDSLWFLAFKEAYNENKDLDLARKYADIGRLIPGTESFENIMNSLRAVPFTRGGAKVIDRSSKYCLQSEYDFSSVVKIVDLVAGADYRLTRLNSEGTIFIDEPGEPLIVNQYAAFAQATKKLFRDHLKLLAALRFDKADNFKGVWAPRLAAVYHPGDQNYFRTSWQYGFRLPDPQLQFMDIQLSPKSHRLGGTAIVDAPYYSRHNSFTQASTVIFNSLVDSFLMIYPDSLDAAINHFSGVLQQSPYDYIQPEKVQTLELGYQRLLFGEQLYFDVNYFHNEYSGFIFSTVLVKPKSGGPGNPADLIDAAYAIDSGAVENFMTVVNSPDKIIMDGIEMGASFLLPRGYKLTGNFTWIHSNVMPGKHLPGIRTPPFKSNVSISNRDVIKHLGFMINWRWTDAVDNWSNVTDQENIDGYLPACSIIDAQVTYAIPTAALSIKAGASNLLNYYHQDYAQGSSIGG
ncbi:MAG: TonB-dependent receptor, partial [Chitinophagales bacterium]